MTDAFLCDHAGRSCRSGWDYQPLVRAIPPAERQGSTGYGWRAIRSEEFNDQRPLILASP
jgi:hypothetical protein